MALLGAAIGGTEKPRLCHSIRLDGVITTKTDLERGSIDVVSMSNVTIRTRHPHHARAMESRRARQPFTSDGVGR